MADNIAKVAARCAEHLYPPAPFGGEVHQRLERRFGRRGQAVFDILVTLPQNLQIQRDHQRVAFGGPCAFDQAVDVIFVPHRIELKPKGFCCLGCDLFNRIDGHGRQGKGNPESFGRAGGFDFSVGILHPRQTDRRQRHRHCHVAPYHLPRRAAPGHVHRHTLAQADLFKVACVVAKGLFCPAAAFTIVKEHSGDAPFIQAFEVFDICDGRHVIRS